MPQEHRSRRRRRAADGATRGEMDADHNRSALSLLQQEIPHLRRSALGLTRDPHYADDLVQECLVRAVANIGRWQAGTNIRAWLLTILRNVFRNDLRRARRDPIREAADDAELCVAVPAAQEARLALNEVHDAFQALTEDHREVLLLVGVEGLSYEEAAAVLEIPVETMRSRLARARQALRRTIETGRVGRPNPRKETRGG